MSFHWQMPWQLKWSFNLHNSHQLTKKQLKTINISYNQVVGNGMCSRVDACNIIGCLEFTRGLFVRKWCGHCPCSLTVYKSMPHRKHGIFTYSNHDKLRYFLQNTHKIQRYIQINEIIRQRETITMNILQHMVLNEPRDDDCSAYDSFAAVYYAVIGEFLYEFRSVIELIW